MPFDVVPGGVLPAQIAAGVDEVKRIIVAAKVDVPATVDGGGGEDGAQGRERPEFVTVGCEGVEFEVAASDVDDAVGVDRGRAYVGAATAEGALPEEVAGHGVERVELIGVGGHVDFAVGHRW
ncbi:MAG: hypothetical protein QM778_23075 [Myxococcales bacterium]